MVAGLVMQTIQLMRMGKCKHENWEMINDHEDQCSHCGVIATEEGKKNLERLRVKP
jgi:hypothetical protein